MDSRSTRVIQAQFNKATRTPSEHLRFYMCEDNVRIWYVLMHNFAGNEGEYLDGEYLVRIELTEEFPYKPPNFYFMTRQGLYDIEKTVCVDIGKFHAANYPAALGVAGFTGQLLSGLIGWKEMTKGISILDTTTAEKRQLADMSVSANWTHHADIMKKIDASYAQYSAKWTDEKPTRS